MATSKNDNTTYTYKSVDGTTSTIRVGENGVTTDKKEGDGCTPAGYYAIGPCYGEEDASVTEMEYHQIVQGDYWVNDPDSEDYNTFVHIDDPDTIDVSVIGGKTDSIIIYDSNIKTSRGVSVGNTDKDVTAAYGEGEASKLDGSNEIDYDFGDYTLVFFLEKNNTVKAIGYQAN